MLMYALVVFGVAALGGLFLASFVLRDKFAPWAVSVLHMMLGAIGLVILILGVVNGEGASRATAALGILVIAALGGFYLASLHLKQKIPGRGIVLAHAGFAVVGFLTLLTTVL